MMRRRGRRDDGSILVLALLVSAAASIAGMWLIVSTDLRVRSNRYLVGASDAASVAASGLQYARIQLNRNMGWTGIDLTSPNAEFGGAIHVEASPTTWGVSHAVASGRVGVALQWVHADLRAVVHPTLAFNFVSNTTVMFSEASLSGRVRANGNVLASGNLDFAGDVTTTTGSIVNNQINSNQVVFDDANLNAPTVNLATYQSLSSPMMGVPRQPPVGGPFVLDTVSFTPTHNPYGATNSNGAYLLDAGGGDVVLRNVYLLGTLTVLNARTVSTDRGFHAERSNSSLATLVVDGSLDLHLENDLSEDLLLTDFNSDGDMVDSFEAEVDGIVYATGDFSGPYAGALHGAVLANKITIAGMCDVQPLPSLATQPVREFISNGPWELIVGSIGSGP